MGCHYPSPTSNDPPKSDRSLQLRPKELWGLFSSLKLWEKKTRSSGLSSVFHSNKWLFWNV